MVALITPLVLTPAQEYDLRLRWGAGEDLFYRSAVMSASNEKGVVAKYRASVQLDTYAVKPGASAESVEVKLDSGERLGFDTLSTGIGWREDPEADPCFFLQGVVLPEGPVAVGHSWEHPVVPNATSRTTRIFTLVKVDDGVATVLIEEHLYREPDREPMRESGHGLLEIDLDEGRITTVQMVSESAYGTIKFVTRDLVPAFIAEAPSEEMLVALFKEEAAFVGHLSEASVDGESLSGIELRFDSLAESESFHERTFVGSMKWKPEGVITRLEGQLQHGEHRATAVMTFSETGYVEGDSSSGIVPGGLYAVWPVKSGDSFDLAGSWIFLHGGSSSAGRLRAGRKKTEGAR